MPCQAMRLRQRQRQNCNSSHMRHSLYPRSLGLTQSNCLFTKHQIGLSHGAGGLSLSCRQTQAADIVCMWHRQAACPLLTRILPSSLLLTSAHTQAPRAVSTCACSTGKGACQARHTCTLSSLLHVTSLIHCVLEGVQLQGRLPAPCIICPSASLHSSHYEKTGEQGMVSAVQTGQDRADDLGVDVAAKLIGWVTCSIV